MFSETLQRQSKQQVDYDNRQDEESGEYTGQTGGEEVYLEVGDLNNLVVNSS